jgi:hypothetical protein
MRWGYIAMSGATSENEKPKVGTRRRHLRPEEAQKLIATAGSAVAIRNAISCCCAWRIVMDCVPARLWGCYAPHGVEAVPRGKPEIEGNSDGMIAEKPLSGPDAEKAIATATGCVQKVKPNLLKPSQN